MTDEQIDCCRRIGRDEDLRVTTIGLSEIDALCEEAVLRGSERDAAAESAGIMRTALCRIVDILEHGDWDDLVLIRALIASHAKSALDGTALHPVGGTMWQGVAVECKAWEKRARDAEGRTVVEDEDDYGRICDGCGSTRINATETVCLACSNREQP